MTYCNPPLPALEYDDQREHGVHIFLDSLRGRSSCEQNVPTERMAHKVEWKWRWQGGHVNFGRQLVVYSVTVDDIAKGWRKELKKKNEILGKIYLFLSLLISSPFPFHDFHLTYHRSLSLSLWSPKLRGAQVHRPLLPAFQDSMRWKYISLIIHLLPFLSSFCYSPCPPPLSFSLSLSTILAFTLPTDSHKRIFGGQPMNNMIINITIHHHQTSSLLKKK